MWDHAAKIIECMRIECVCMSHKVVCIFLDGVRLSAGYCIHPGPTYHFRTVTVAAGLGLPGKRSMRMRAITYVFVINELICE